MYKVTESGFGPALERQSIGQRKGHWLWQGHSMGKSSMDSAYHALVVVCIDIVFTAGLS